MINLLRSRIYEQLHYEHIMIMHFLTFLTHQQILNNFGVNAENVNCVWICKYSNFIHTAQKYYCANHHALLNETFRHKNPNHNCYQRGHSPVLKTFSGRSSHIYGPRSVTDTKYKHVVSSRHVYLRITSTTAISSVNHLTRTRHSAVF